MSHFRRGQIKDMHDAQMNLTNRGGVVVDQSQAAFLKGSFDLHFLGQFAAQAGAIRVGSGIQGIDMPAQTDGTQGPEALFTAFPTTGVME